MRLAVLILAAGSSTRMGEPKQLLPVGDTTLLGVAIKNALQSNADEIYCVLGANEAKIKKSISIFNVETIFNPKHKDGISSSIAEGIRFLKLKNFDAVVIALGDQPFVDPEFLNRLIDTYKNNPQFIIASGYENNNGVPAVFPKVYFDKLMKLKGDKGAKEFLNSKNHSILVLDSEKIDDIDTIKDYQNLIKK